MKKYYSVPEAAKICSVDSSTMHRWVASGKIKFYSTAGGHKRILPEDLKEWMDKNRIFFDIDSLESKKARILVVDDDDAVLRYLNSVLKGVFVNIDFAKDGFEAGKKVISFKPHLIILDLAMPNMDGFEVCRQIRSDPATEKIKILILSGNLDEDSSERALRFGADALLEKPSSKKELLQYVEDLLEGKKIESKIIQG